MRSHIAAVAITTAAIGAFLGAASAYEDGFGLMAVMAVVGVAFGLPVGAGISVLARALFRDLPRAARVDDEDGEHLRKQLEELRDHKAFSDDYYPGNPDPDARAISGWKTPESHGSAR